MRVTVQATLGIFALMGGLLVLVLVVSVLVGVHRLDGRSHDESPGSGAVSGALGELIEVFQPSRAHVVAEMERKRHGLFIAPTSAPGWDVDLDRGTAVLRQHPDEPIDPRA